MITITLELFGPLRERAGEALVLTLPDGATVGDAFLAAFGDTVARDLPLRAARGVEWVPLSEPLMHDDRVALIPPVGGG